MLEPGKQYQAPRYSKDVFVIADAKRISCNVHNLAEQVGELLQEGAASRMVGRTVFNPRSSRSHAIATLHINWRRAAKVTGAAADTPTPPSTPPDGQGGSARTHISRHAAETRLYLVDLAGSERAGQ